jgi:hypothetical protein
MASTHPSAILVTKGYTVLFAVKRRATSYQ